MSVLESKNLILSQFEGVCLLESAPGIELWECWCGTNCGGRTVSYQLFTHDGREVFKEYISAVRAFRGKCQ